MGDDRRDLILDWRLWSWVLAAILSGLLADFLGVESRDRVDGAEPFAVARE